MARTISKWAGPGALAVLALDYAWIQLGALPAAKRAVPYGFLHAVPFSWGPVLERVAPPLALPAALGAVALTVLILAEARRGRLARLFTRAEASERVAWMMVAGVAALLGLAFLAPGRMSRGDSITHLLRAGELAQELARGRIPTWTDRWYGGYPFGEFYSQLTNLAVAAVGAVAGGVNAGAKIVVYLCHVAGALGMYLFMSRAARNRTAGIVSGILYASARPRALMILFHGNLPGALFFALLPFAFAAADRAAARGRFRDALVLALLLAALAESHVAYLRPAAPLWLAVLAVLVWVRGEDAAGRRRGAAALLGGHALALGLAAFFLAPLLLERHLVAFPRVVSRLALPGPRQALYPVTPSVFNPAYQGIAVVLVAGAAFAARGRGARLVAAALWAGAGAAFVLWWAEPWTPYVVGFALAGAAGMGTAALAGRRRSPGRWTVALLAVALVEQAPFLFMSTYVQREPPPAVSEPALERLLGTDSGGYSRVLEGWTEASGFRFYPWATFRSPRIPTLAGPFVQGLPRSFRPSGELLGYAAGTLSGGAVDSLTALCLNVLDVAVIVPRHGEPGRFPDVRSGRYAEPLLEGPGFRIPGATPVLFAPRVASVPESAAFRDDALPWTGTDPAADYSRSRALKVVRAMAVDPGARRAACFYLDPALDAAMDEPAPAPAFLDSGEDGNARGGALRVLEARSEGGTLALRLVVPGPGFVRVARNGWPHRRVTVDGSEAPSTLDALGGVVVRVEPGTQRVEVAATLSPLRRAAAGASLLILLTALVLEGSFTMRARRGKETIRTAGAPR